MAGEKQLSVVVPVYGVEEYLAACLDSVLAQDIDNIEVLVIDDGSPDASGDIAEAYAARDRRVMVHHQDNVGLGATRNRGAALATGRYLAFVDSDDVLPARAYRRLLAAIEASGSDLVTGDVRRLTSLGPRRSPTFSPIYHPARTATHITRDHALLQDRIAPNKLFRRDFWLRHGLAFREGVLYEDSPAVLQAHVLAHQVDVVDRPVYHWRIREGADRSITQQRLAPTALRDRIDGVQALRRFLAERAADGDGACAELARAYDRLVLVDDLRWFADQLDRADDEQVAGFVERAGALLATIDPDVVAALPARDRLRWHLVATGDAERLVADTRHRRIDPHRPAQRRGGTVHLDPPFPPPRRRIMGGSGRDGADDRASGGRWPARLTRLHDDELELRAGISDLTVDDGRIVIDGWAAVSHHPVATPRDRRLRVWLELAGGDERIELEPRDRASPEATAADDHGRYDRRGAGFRVEVDAAELASRWQRGVARWRLHVEVTCGRTRRTGRVTRVLPGRPRRPEPVDLGRLRVGPRVGRDGLELAVSARPVRLVDAATVDGGAFELSLASRRDLVAVTWSLGEDEQGRIEVVAADDGGLAARLDAGVLAAAAGGGAGGGRRLTLHAVSRDARSARISADGGVDQQALAVPGGAVVLEMSRYGYLGVLVTGPTLLIDAAASTVDGLELGGRLFGAEAGRLEVSLEPRGRHDPRLVRVVAAAAGAATAESGPAASSASSVASSASSATDAAPPGEPVRLELHSAEVARDVGSAELSARLRSDGSGEQPVDVEVVLARSLIASLPWELPPVRAVAEVPGWAPGAGSGGGDARATASNGAQLPVRFDDHDWQRPVVVVDDDLAADERAPADQQRLAAVARRRRRAAVDDPREAGVLVVAGGGGSTHGCPRAVAEALHALDPQVPLRWAVRHAAVRPPLGATAVAVGSRDWHATLTSAAAVVTDRPLPAGFEPRRGQQVVRLWSGVPVRPLGRRAPGVRGAEQPADATAWTHVVAAGASAAATLVDAFALDRDPLSLGLPRHDVLDGPAGRDRARAAARQRLGLADHEPAILHLPTWSDSQRHPGGALRRVGDLDPQRLLAAVDLLLAERAQQLELPGGAGNADAKPALPQLLVRGHPAAVDTYAELDPLDRLCDLRGDVEVVDLLLAADVVVAHPSSVALEAVRAGTPVIVHDPAGFGLADELGEPAVDVVSTARPAAATSTEEELAAALVEVLSARAPHAAAPHEWPPADAPGAGGAHLETVGGGAARAVAELLLDPASRPQ